MSDLELTLSYRSQLGPELQIVVLDMAVEEQMERVREAYGEESAVEISKVSVTSRSSVKLFAGNL